MEIKYTAKGTPFVEYNGCKYYKHPKQKYFYNPKSSPDKYSRSLHKQVYFDNYGSVPDGFHVHHKDNNQFNNSASNLEAIPAFDHLSAHAKENSHNHAKWQAAGQDAAKEWHKSEDGIKWHSNHAIKCGFGKQTFGEAPCESCGKIYLRGHALSRFCSNACKSAWRRKNCPDKKMVDCKTCGKSFETLKYLPNKYCSKACKPAPNPEGYRARKQPKSK